MSGETEQIEKQFRTIKIIALAMLVGGPIAFLVIATVLNMQQPPEGTPVTMIIYLFLMIAIGCPALVPIIARHHIQNYRSSQNTAMTPMNLFFTISIIGMVFVEASYIYGFISFMLTGEFVNMFYFYPIGMVWSYIHWPRHEKYDQLVERLNRP